MTKAKLLTTLLLFILLSTPAISSAGGSCIVPGHLKEGQKYRFYFNSRSYVYKLIEIDKKSCWVQIHDEKRGENKWVNLGQVVQIGNE